MHSAYTSHALLVRLLVKNRVTVGKLRCLSCLRGRLSCDRSKSAHAVPTSKTNPQHKPASAASSHAAPTQVAICVLLALVLLLHARAVADRTVVHTRQHTLFGGAPPSCCSRTRASHALPPELFVVMAGISGLSEQQKQLAAMAALAEAYGSNIWESAVRCGAHVDTGGRLRQRLQQPITGMHLDLANGPLHPSTPALHFTLQLHACRRH